MSTRDIEQHIADLENVYDELNLDGLQMEIIRAAGPYWADDINTAIAHLDYEFRDALAGMQREADRP